MSIFEHAKKVELNGINFYQDELKRTNMPELKKILQTLIDEEQDHYIFWTVFSTISSLKRYGRFILTR